MTANRNVRRALLSLVGLALTAVPGLVPPAAAEHPPGLLRTWQPGPVRGGAAFLDADHIVVHVQGEHPLQVFTRDGVLVREMATEGSGDGQLRGGGSIASDGTYIYVCDLVRRSVEVLDTQGAFVRRIAPREDGKPVFLRPVAVGVDPDGSVYVLDQYLGRVFRTDASGSVVGSFGSALSGPRSLAVDRRGVVYVGDGQNMVWLFEGTSGGQIGAWPLPAAILDQGDSRPYDVLGVGALAVERGDVYASVDTQWGARILKLGTDGTGITSFGNKPYVALNLDDRGILYALTPGTGMEVWDNKPYVSPPHDFTTDAALWLHVVHADNANSCTAGPGNPRQAVTHVPANGDPYQIYLVGSPDTKTGSGLTGMQIGIGYDTKMGQKHGIVVQNWVSCSDLQFVPEDWPQPGSGNTITWAKQNCQSSDAVVAGYFNVTAYGAAAMWLTGYPVTGLAKVANCGGSEGIPELTVPPKRLGWVSFGDGAHLGSTDGCNPIVDPCASPTAARPTTWSGIKNTFGAGN